MSRSWKRSRRRGSNLTEFVLVAPFLLVFISGIIDYSWYMVQYRAVVNSVREGCRIGAASRDAAYDAVGQTAAQNSMTEYGLTETVTCQSGSLATSGNPTITCSVSYTYSPLIGFYGVTMGGTAISYSLTMRAFQI